jgi:hypothetical protein
MSGETNRLIGLAKEISPTPDPRELDVIASTGEQVTIALLAMAMHAKRACKAKSYTGAQVGVLTDSTFTKARILQDRRGTDSQGSGRRQRRRRRRLPGGRRGRQHHDARPWWFGHLGGGAGRGDECGRVPDLYRRRWRLHDRPARRAGSAQARHDHFRRDAGNGQPRLQGAADPLGRVRRQIQSQTACAFQLRGRRRRHADHC